MGRRSRSPSRSPSRSRSSRHRHDNSRRDDRSRGRHERERERSPIRSRGRAERSDRRPPSSPEHAPAAPKVTEENGEVTLSIEETNKLRISLGLKPLSLENKAEKNVVNLQKTSAQVAEANEQAALKRALEKSKKRRELTQKLAGKSIGEQLQETSAASALDWVKKSREVVAAQKKQAEVDSRKSHKSKAVEEDTYDASALAGMTVGHDLNAFDEGEEVVLTLKDSSVLKDDGNDVNDDDDELVNVELSERDRRETRQKQALRALQPVYSGFDDDEFVEMGGALKRKKAKKSAVLAHYDDDDEVKQAEEAKKFTLDAHGSTVVVAKRTGGNAAAAKDDVDEEVVSLSRTKSKAMDDFYTAEEMEAQFNKKSKKLRRKKKLRKLVEEDADDATMGDQDDTSALLQQLEEEAKQTGRGSADRGRRRRPAHDDDDEEEANLRRFQEARDKASAIAQSALAASAAGAVKRKKRRVEMEDDVDLELSANLTRARALAQLKQQDAAPSAVGSEDKIAAIVSSAVGSVDDEGDERMEHESRLPAGNVFDDAEAERKSNAVVFNDATDFETRLRSAMEQRSTQLVAAATAPSSVQSAVRQGEGDMEVDSGNAQGEACGHDKDEETKDGEGDEGWADDQPLVGTGMGATLALLRRTGDLRESRVERQAGRANDARDRNVDDELKVKDGVKLDYRDEFGRLLTKKEAFRLLSYKFHGHKPGKKKQEKRLKQVKEELESQKLLSGEGSTKMMKVLEKKQGQAKQAYVVLSNGT